MGKLIVVKGADFSENAFFQEKDFNILVAANSVAYVILNATDYNPAKTTSEKGGTVVTLDNTENGVDRWFNFNPSDYISEELQYLNGAFSTWSDYTNNKIKKIKIKANNLHVNTTSWHAIYGPIFSSNIIKEAIFETNICPDNLSSLSLDYLRLKVPSIVRGIIPYQQGTVVNVLDISGASINYVSNGYQVGSPLKVIVNGCTQASISNFINSQVAVNETYVQTTDAAGNVVLIKQTNT